MPEKSLLEALPFELVKEISSYLDYKSVGAASTVSQAWRGLFNNNSIWKYRLIEDFDVDAQLLAKTFQNEIENKTLNYKQLYGRLHCLSKQSNSPNFIRCVFRDKTQHPFLLLACTDNIAYLNSMTREQQYTLAMMAIYMGCFKIPTKFIENFKDKNLLINILGHAAKSGNFQVVQYLLNSDNNFGLKPRRSTLNCAAKSGDLQLVQYLLNEKNNFKLKPNQNTLECSAGSGNLQLVQYLLHKENNFELKPVENTLNCAAKSGKLQVVEYLVNNCGLIPVESTLEQAAHSGDVQLIQYLLNTKNNFGFKPDVHVLNNAAQSGNFHLVQYLLNAENNFGLKPKHSTLNCAAGSGNLQLVQYLAENFFHSDLSVFLLEDAAKSGNLQLVQCLLDKFKLAQYLIRHYKPTDDDETSLLMNACGINSAQFTLNAAAKSGNLQLVQYLLKSENNFDVKPNNVTLKCAAESDNLQLVQYLMKPEDYFLEGAPGILLAAINSKNFMLSEYLLPSHSFLLEALQVFGADGVEPMSPLEEAELIWRNEDNITAAKNLLQKSYIACPTHYEMILQYILNNPKRFNLNEESIQCLENVAKNLGIDVPQESFLEEAEPPVNQYKNYCILF